MSPMHDSAIADAMSAVVHAVSGQCAIDAMAICEMDVAQYGEPHLAAVQYAGAAIVVAIYLSNWLTVRQVVTDLINAMLDDVDDHGPNGLVYITMLGVMTSVSNVVLIIVAIVLVLGVIDLTLLDMVWHTHPEDGRTQFPLSCLRLLWLAVNMRVVIAIVLAQGMTALVCYGVLLRLQARYPPPLLRTAGLRRDVTLAVDAIMGFNLAAIVMCVILQLVFQEQWDTESGRRV